MEVKNINGSGTRSSQCTCGNWLNHWENFTNNSSPVCCCVENCFNKPEVGAHIIKAGITDVDRSEYIVPMCKACNNITDNFEISDDIPLASANQSNTCG